MTRQVTGELYKKMITNAAAAIEIHKQEVNELNVFPVPDGDTGTNMSLTMNAAEKALASMSPGTLGYTVDVSASALLRGARGNSGVILSLLFRGFAKRLKDVDSADSKQFASALLSGVESAYNAVMKPTEGTILTVSRLAAGSASAAAETERDIEIVLEKALETGYVALAETVNQNPVLKKANVIDAGAKGYLYILDGMLKAMRGVVLTKQPPSADDGEKADFAQFAAEDIKYIYCTEFIAEKRFKTDANRLRDFLDKRGDCVVVVDDDEIIKVHAHSNTPGIILTEALNYGPLLSVKVENMREQHSQALLLNGAAARSIEFEKALNQDEAGDSKEFGMVAVCAGAGIEEVFRDLGVGGIITGGQTMNPSTEDILKIIDVTPSDVVFVLPNNKNIIMAAQQCVSMTDKRVIVIPTKSIPQGISALLAADGLSNVDEMTTSMTEAAKRVRTALITDAARDSDFEGAEIKKGEYLALIDDSLAASGPDADAVIDAVADALASFSPEFVTVFVGEGIGDDEAKAATNRISSAMPGAEISMIRGEQAVYHFIISAE